MEIDYLDEVEPSQEYVDAFNDGYYLSQYMPELSDSLARSSGETEILKGFKDGKETYSNEHFESKLPKFMRNNPLESKESDIEKDKFIDRDIENDRER